MKNKRNLIIIICAFIAALSIAFVLVAIFQDKTPEEYININGYDVPAEYVEYEEPVVIPGETEQYEEIIQIENSPESNQSGQPDQSTPVIFLDPSEN